MTKGKAIRPVAPSQSGAPVCWASLFETPRLTPVSRPKSPMKEISAAMNVIASVEPILISWKALQVPCRMRNRGMLNNGNMCFLNAVPSECAGVHIN